MKSAPRSKGCWSSSDGLEVPPPAKLRIVTPALVQEVRKLKVKPAKGRFQGSEELNRLVDDLANRVSIAQERDKGTGKG